VVQDQGDSERIRKGIVPHKLGGRAPDLRGPDADSHLPPGLRTGLGLRIGPGILSGTRLRIERQLRDREDKGKSHAHPATPTFPADCPMLEPLPTPTSRTASARDPRTASGGQHSEQPAGSNPAPSPGIRRSTISGTPGSWTPRAEETCDLEDEVVPSPNMRRALTRMHAKASPGFSSLVGGLDRDWKERATPKKFRPS